MLEGRQRAPAHAHARVPDPAGLVAGLDLRQVPALAAAQLIPVDLEKTRLG